jgi:DNA-nicking Smr family endonuclease
MLKNKPSTITQKEKDLFAKAMSEPMLVPDKDASSVVDAKLIHAIDIGDISSLNIQDITAEQSIFFKREVISEAKFKKFARGKWYVPTPVTSLDLHGLTIEETCGAVADVMAIWQSQQISCGLLIHGKSQHSAYAKIKSFLAAWLKTLTPVLAYASARNQDGGTGAIYVLLKKV